MENNNARRNFLKQTVILSSLNTPQLQVVRRNHGGGPQNSGSDSTLDPVVQGLILYGEGGKTGA